MKESEIPTVIFDWLQARDADQLTKQEILVVESCLGLETYTEMRTALFALKRHARFSCNEDRQALLDAYDRDQKLNGLGFRHDILLKAAAVLLPVGLLAFLLVFLKPVSPDNMQKAVTADTVYLERLVQVPAMAVRDTVFVLKRIVEEVSAPQSAAGQGWGALPEVMKPGDMDLKSIHNSIRSNNAVSDSILQLFPSVSI